jgi:hypothetical protein
VTTTRAFSFPFRKIMIVMIAGAMAWATTHVTPPPVADAAGSGFFRRPEICLMKRINAKRAARGQRRLQRDAQLGYVARRHAAKMARERNVWHDRRVGRKVTRWYRLGQNTGRTTRCRRIIRSFLRSSAHRANIFGTWTHIGAGVVKSGRYKYVQILFESTRDPGNIWGYPRS